MYIHMCIHHVSGHRRYQQRVRALEHTGIGYARVMVREGAIAGLTRSNYRLEENAGFNFPLCAFGS